MSTYSLTKGSAVALGMLASQAGSETLLLTQPARELRAEVSIEPFTGDNGDQLQAVLFMREQRHSMTLQRNDGANVQHLADWIEAVANGTLDTAQAIPQRQPVLLPCCRCEGEAIAYSYLAPAPAQHDRHGVKCRHRDCQSLERAATAAAAADAWNDIQREELDEVAPAHDGQEALEAIEWLDDFVARCNGDDRGSCHSVNVIRAALTSLAQQPIAVPEGWKLVPVKPDIEMVEAGYETSLGQPDRSGHARAIEMYEAMLNAAPIAQLAPDGWQLVPKEPTKAMREAFHAATERYEDGYGESPDSQWDAMLRAALATSPTA